MDETNVQIDPATGLPVVPAEEAPATDAPETEAEVPAEVTEEEAAA